MSEIIKQEGDFKVKKTKPRNLTKESEIVKVDFSMPKVEQEVTKVVIPNLEKEENAIQKQSTDESLLRAEQPKVELQEMERRDEGSFENVIQEITDEEVKKEVVVIETEVEKHIQEQEKTGKPLPENIEKLITFMEDTGGTVEDYVRLNTDYSNVDEKTLLREYYTRTKPHLDKEEIQFLIEDSFEYDEDIEEEREIRKKKLDFKEEVAKAKSHLETVKDKYYDEIKLRPGISKEQKEASDFFNRYKKNEDDSKMRHEKFKQDTKSLFNEDFKGFEYNVGEKRFRYGVQNNEQLAEKQSDINNFIGKFLDKDGNVSDAKNYHKALYTAMNSDKIAQHFYEQGKVDAIKEVVNNSKNPASTQPRQTSGEVFINGLKVKAISGFDSSKLKIQTRKFNN
jgi:hypothetical protein